MQNGKRRQKEQLYRLFSQVSSALANPHRLEMVDLLAQAPRTVEEMATELSMSAANTSQHLQRLKRARLVVDEREGVYVRYRLASPQVARLWLELRSTGERQLAEVEGALDAYRNQRHDFEKVAPQDLPAHLKSGQSILLDVRPSQEYQTAHLPGAISIPVTELEDRVDELPKDKRVIAYCRGPYCVYADQALEILFIRGWKVARLEYGVAEWQAAGYDLEFDLPDAAPE